MKILCLASLLAFMACVFACTSPGSHSDSAKEQSATLQRFPPGQTAEMMHARLARLFPKVTDAPDKWAGITTGTGRWTVEKEQSPGRYFDVQISDTIMIASGYVRDDDLFADISQLAQHPTVVNTAKVIQAIAAGSDSVDTIAADIARKVAAARLNPDGSRRDYIQPEPITLSGFRFSLGPIAQQRKTTGDWKHGLFGFVVEVKFKE